MAGLLSLFIVIDGAVNYLTFAHLSIEHIRRMSGRQ